MASSNASKIVQQTTQMVPHEMTSICVLKERINEETAHIAVSATAASVAVSVKLRTDYDVHLACMWLCQLDYALNRACMWLCQLDYALTTTSTERACGCVRLCADYDVHLACMWLCQTTH